MYDLDLLVCTDFLHPAFTCHDMAYTMCKSSKSINQCYCLFLDLKISTLSQKVAAFGQVRVIVLDISMILIFTSKAKPNNNVYSTK